MSKSFREGRRNRFDDFDFDFDDQRVTKAQKLEARRQTARQKRNAFNENLQPVDTDEDY